MSATINQIEEYISLDDVDVVLYHSNCCDGFGAAWCVWAASTKDDIEFVGCSHLAKNTEIEDIIDAVQNKNVLMFDFCFKSDVLSRIDESARKFAILDHHTTALEEIQRANLEDRSVLDVTRSGCSLAWEYSFSQSKKEVPEMPRFLKFIQDRDLWRYELPDTKAFVAAVYPTIKYTFDDWLHFQDDDVVDKYISEGKIILKYQKLEIEKLAESAKYVFDWNGYNIKVINATNYISDLGNYLAKKADFALLWWYDAHRQIIKVSLRSDAHGNNVNVANIAKKYGGGGHPNAAGFSWNGPIEKLLFDTELLSDSSQEELEECIIEDLEIDEDDVIASNEDYSDDANTGLLPNSAPERTQNCGSGRVSFKITLISTFLGVVAGFFIGAVIPR